MTTSTLFSTRLSTCTERIRQFPDQARVALLHVDEEGATKQALALASRHQMGYGAGPLAGLVCSVKACLDVEGWLCHAGSAALQHADPAPHDAPVVAALRSAGAVLLAQTNMTEFAYGALGVNSHFGTPLTPLYPDSARVAGGSSSGAAVSVALGFADIALCSDTSGSARIPAAFCGVVGYIPTYGRWPTAGMRGLAPSFDVPGIMASNTAVCRQVIGVLDGAFCRSTYADATGRDAGHCSPASQELAGERAACMNPAKTLPLLVPDELVNARPERAVSDAFEAALARLQAAGMRIERRSLPALRKLGAITGEAGMIAAEAYSLHRALLAQYAAQYEPLVRRRIQAGARVPAYRYASAMWALRERAKHYEMEMAGYAALLTPTSPILPPLLHSLADEDCYLETNQRSFVYTEIANRLHAPSISLPSDGAGDSPVGLLLTGRSHHDADLLEVARTVETILRDAYDADMSRQNQAQIHNAPGAKQ